MVRLPLRQCQTTSYCKDCFEASILSLDGRSIVDADWPVSLRWNGVCCLQQQLSWGGSSFLAWQFFSLSTLVLGFLLHQNCCWLPAPSSAHSWRPRSCNICFWRHRRQYCTTKKRLQYCAENLLRGMFSVTRGVLILLWCLCWNTLNSGWYNYSNVISVQS